MNFPFSIISGKTISALIEANIETCTQHVKDAYLTHGAGDSVNPNSYFLRYPKNPSARIIALPAHLDGRSAVSGIKWIASFPANVKRGFPRASAVLILNDPDTGYPFACLESSIISAARTAASAALGAAALNHGQKRVASLGIVGTGLIARYILKFLCGLGWQMDTLRLHDRDRLEAERFAQALPRRPGDGVDCVVHDDVEGLVRASDVVVLATTAASPYIDDPSLFRHHPVVLNVSLRDLAPRILLEDAVNVVDDVDHVMNANTSPHLAEQVSGGRSFVDGTLAEVLTGKVRVDRSKTRIFSPFGLGVLDLAVGKWLYEMAMHDGTALPVDDFFFELSR
jgi:2,3-diaminopropionate biosynthesis protein SbnB